MADDVGSADEAKPRGGGRKHKNDDGDDMVDENGDEGGEDEGGEVEGVLSSLTGTQQSGKRKRKPSKRMVEAAKADEEPAPNEEEQQQAAKKRKVSRPKKLYCTCREPYSSRKPMIGCDHCDEWFHLACVGVKTEEADDIASYKCPNCVQLGDAAPPAKHAPTPAAKEGEEEEEDIFEEPPEDEPEDSDDGRKKKGKRRRKKNSDDEDYEEAVGTAASTPKTKRKPMTTRTRSGRKQQNKKKQDDDDGEDGGGGGGGEVDEELAQGDESADGKMQCTRCFKHFDSGHPGNAGECYHDVNRAALISNEGGKNKWQVQCCDSEVETEAGGPLRIIDLPEAERYCPNAAHQA